MLLESILVDTLHHHMMRGDYSDKHCNLALNSADLIYLDSFPLCTFLVPFCNFEYTASLLHKQT